MAVSDVVITETDEVFRTSRSRTRSQALSIHEAIGRLMEAALDRALGFEHA